MPPDDAAAFVQFSLRLFSRDGVAPLCISLQDRHGLNVNCLLLAAWAAHLGYAIDSGLWRELQALTDPIRRGAVEPIRAVRRQVSSAPRLSDDLRAPLKRLLLYAEVRAEQAEERALHQHMVSRAPRHQPGPSLLADNLTAYAGGLPDLARFATLVVESRLLEQPPCPSA
ncbi:MAG: TIGR02444 family protein [Candidatus Solibacter usitatus]|nr:TIGR02444 family protein [Candidatus Solibacter usitatus]